MNKLRLYILFFITTFLISIPEGVYSQDGLFTNLLPMERGNWAVSVSPAIYPDSDSDFLGFLRARYALSDQWSANAKLGVLSNTTYFGLDTRYRWSTQSDKWQLESTLGIQHFSEIGIKLASSASFEFDRFSAYGGLDYQPYFRDNDVSHVLLIPIGVSIPLLNEKLNFLFEFDIPISNQAESFQAISFGLSYRLD